MGNFNFNINIFKKYLNNNNKLKLTNFNKKTLK